MNHCVTCEQTFSCMSAFDAHATSDGDRCLEPASVGLEFYTPTGKDFPMWCWPVATHKRNDEDGDYIHSRSLATHKAR